MFYYQLAEQRDIYNFLRQAFYLSAECVSLQGDEVKCCAEI